MPRGGARPGAGRKPGGTRAKAPGPIQLAREEVRLVLKHASSPLAVLCELAANANLDATLRIQAAAAACPFLYPRLSAAVVGNVSDNISRPTQKALLDKLNAQFQRLSTPPTETIEVLPPETEPETIDVVAIEVPETSD